MRGPPDSSSLPFVLHADQDNIVTMHDVMDAQHVFDTTRDGAAHCL